VGPQKKAIRIRVIAFFKYKGKRQRAKEFHRIPAQVKVFRFIR
jgi:hypothetical protein